MVSVNTLLNVIDEVKRECDVELVNISVGSTRFADANIKGTMLISKGDMEGVDKNSEVDFEHHMGRVICSKNVNIRYSSVKGKNVDVGKVKYRDGYPLAEATLIPNEDYGYVVVEYREQNNRRVLEFIVIDDSLKKKLEDKLD